MALPNYKINITGFTDGLNTEATAINVLPSEMMDGTVNIELLSNGAVRPRRGLNFLGEASNGQYLHAVRTSTVSAEQAIESPSAYFCRLTAANGAAVEKLIVDLNNQFRIYNANFEDLRNFNTPSQTIARTNRSADEQIRYNMQYAQSGSKVFFAGKHTQPGYLDINSDNDSLDIAYFDCFIRDPEQKQRGSRVKHDPANDSVSGVNRLFECIKAHTSDHANKPGDGTGNWREYWIELFIPVPTSVPQWTSGSSYVTSIIKRYDSAETVTSATTRPSTIEFHAGRVWIGGDPKYPNEILFSQVIKSDEYLGRFFQEADPFDPDDPNLVDSDGGVIRLQGAGRVLKLISNGDSLIVTTTTGAWEIVGENGVFKATAFSSKLVLKDAIYGVNNAILADDVIIIAGQNAVWSTRKRDALSTPGGASVFDSISDKRIKRLWQRVPIKNKESATFIYASADKKVYLLFNRVLTDTDRMRNPYSQPGYYRSALIYNTNEQDSVGDAKRTANNAWTYYEYEDVSNQEKPYIAFPFVAPAFEDTRVNVVDDDDETVVVGTDTVYVSYDPEVEETSQPYFITLLKDITGSTVNILASIGRFIGPTVTDWPLDSNYRYNFPAVLKSGVSTLGDVSKPKTPQYIFVVFEQLQPDQESVDSTIDNTFITIDSDAITIDESDSLIVEPGCLLRAAYNFAIDENSTKYGPAYDVYIQRRTAYVFYEDAPNGVNHAWFKHRVRGRGNVVQIIFEKKDDNDFKLIGWNLSFNNNAD